MTGELEGKVALVTGASSGIGAAIARRFAQQGAEVAAIARRQERLSALVEAFPDKIKAFPADITDETSMTAQIEAVFAWRPGLNIVVNNAGLGRDAPLVQGRTEDWRTILETNLLAPMVISREVLSRTNAPVHLVFTSSMSAHRVTRQGGMYAASKAGLRALVESLRKQLRREKRPVRLTLLSPGWVETEFAEVSYGDKERADQLWASVEALTAEDVAEAALFAVSTNARCDINDILLRSMGQEI